VNFRSKMEHNKKREIDLNDPNTLVYYGLRYNELGRIDILGRGSDDDKYLCIVTKDDGSGKLEWLDEDQTQDGYTL